MQISFNQSHTLFSCIWNNKIIIYNVDNLQKKTEIILPDTSRIVNTHLLNHTNILFIHTIDGFEVWDMKHEERIYKQNICIQELCVSDKYIILCTKYSIQLLFLSTLSIYQTFPLIRSYCIGTCVIDYYHNKTTFAYSGSSKTGSFEIFRENTVTTVQAHTSIITSLFLNCSVNRIVSVSKEDIAIFELSSLRLIRRCKNLIGTIHLCSFSINTCLFSNHYGCTQGITIANGKDIYITHRKGLYLILHSSLKFIPKDLKKEMVIHNK